MKKRWNYLICASVILVIAFLMSLRNGLFSAGTAEEVFRVLSDSFFVPGIVFAGCGLLGFASSKGTYDMRINISMMISIIINKSVMRKGGRGSRTCSSVGVWRFCLRCCLRRCFIWQVSHVVQSRKMSGFYVEF